MSIHFRTTYLQGFLLYILDVYVDAVKVTTVCVSDYDGVSHTIDYDELGVLRDKQHVPS